MASIYRYYDGLGRGEFLSRASHPSGKIKKEKAEIFSFHQNRKELGEWGMDGEMKGGGRDASSTLWWSSGRGAPRPAPARRAPGALGLVPRVPRVGHPWLPQAFLSSLTPGPMCLHGHSTQMLICTRPVSPWSPLTPVTCPSQQAPPNPTGEKVFLWVNGTWGRVCLSDLCFSLPLRTALEIL